MQSFTSVIALGLDSFLACAFIGMLSLSARERLRIASAFGVADALATLLGPGVGHGLLSYRPPDISSLEFTAIALCSIVLCGLSAFLFRTSRRPRSLLYLAPLLCSLDNLFAGSPPDSAALAGLSSTCLALAGLAVGLACRSLLTRIAEQA
jgi:putative Mn2+ efflux pump MntP